MTENVENWWQRRRRSKGRDVPYAIGTYRADWARFPILIRQFLPDLNGMLTLTQIPPAADVYLLWVCAAGHRFVATPTEQRERPGRSRRESTWCPECTTAALGRPATRSRETPARASPSTERPPDRRRGRSSRAAAIAPVGPGESVPAAERLSGAVGREAGSADAVRGERMQVGAAFFSVRAPKPSSAAEADLRARVAARLDVDLFMNAVRVRSAFHGRHEVWPDLVIPELMIAIEYDTTGRSAIEHVGLRESSDRRKDQLLRQCGWEVIRIRTSKLEALGPFDVIASGVTDAVVDQVIDRMGEIRGELIVAAYLTRNAVT